MTVQQKKKIFKTVAFVCNVTSSMMEVFENMPDGLQDEMVQMLYDKSIRDFANLWECMASFPDDDNYDFDSILS